MTFQKAKSLLQIDIKTLSDEELQKHKVQVLDAWRYAKGEHGFNNDFFLPVPELKAFVPKDYWLLKNIEHRLNELGL